MCENLDPTWCNSFTVPSKCEIRNMLTIKKYLNTTIPEACFHLHLLWSSIHCLIYFAWLAMVTNTLFSNSLVRARPALSRKNLSLWMARAKIAHTWPALFWCCFYQHQSSARPAPGADQRVSERSSTKFRPKFRLHGQMPHNSRAAPSRLFLKLKLFCHNLIILSLLFLV